MRARNTKSRSTEDKKIDVWCPNLFRTVHAIRPAIRIKIATAKNYHTPPHKHSSQQDDGTHLAGVFFVFVCCCCCCITPPVARTVPPGGREDFRMRYIFFDERAPERSFPIVRHFERTRRPAANIDNHFELTAITHGM